MTEMTTPKELSPDQQKRLLYGDFDISDRELIVGLIRNWNATRMDMFEIKQPEPNSIEFYGVIRFYHQDSAQRVSTKCIRVASSATTQDVIETLAQKFRPDMKMLTSNYGLYEVHSNAKSRKLEASERPIIIQLLWTQEMKEGRLTLRNEDDPVSISLGTPNTDANANPLRSNSANKIKQQDSNFTDESDHEMENQPSRSNLSSQMQHSGSTSTLTKLTRKLTQRKNNKDKTNNRLAAELRRASMKTGHTPFNIESAVAHQVYKEKPETNFTRTISNPEAVIKRQREQKAQQRLMKQSRNIKIYGQDIQTNSDSAKCITLQIIPSATTKQVIQEALVKFNLADEQQVQNLKFLENFVLFRIEVPHNFDENLLSASRETFSGVVSGNKKILQEELAFHHRPLLKLTEFEKVQRLRNQNNLCMFQLRRSKLYSLDLMDMKQAVQAQYQPPTSGIGSGFRF